MDRFITVVKEVEYTKNKYGDDVYEFESDTSIKMRFRFINQEHETTVLVNGITNFEAGKAYLTVVVDNHLEIPVGVYELEQYNECKNSWKDVERIVKLESGKDTYRVQKSSSLAIHNDINYYSIVEKDTTMETLTQIGFTCIGKIQILKSLFILMPDGIYKQIVNHTGKSSVVIKNLEVYTMEEFEATDENKLKGGNIVIKL